MSDTQTPAATENTDAAPGTAAVTPEGTPAASTPSEGAPTTALTGETTDANGTPTEPVKRAPEAYAEFTAPEGVQLGELSDEVKALAKTLDLTQEDAQQVVDLGAKLAQKAAADQAAQVQTIQATWLVDLKADPDIGGDKLDANLARAKEALAATATPQLVTLLARSGLGDHPDVVKLFLKIAPAFLPDTHVPGGKAPGAGTKSAAQVLYPNTR